IDGHFVDTMLIDRLSRGLQGYLSPGGVKGSPGLEDAIDDVQQLAHGGADDKHPWFAPGQQTLAQGLDDRVVAQRRQGGHEQVLSQAAAPHLGEAGAAMNRAARDVLGGCQAGIGGQLLGAREGGDIRQFSQQTGGSQAANAWNGAQQGSLVVQAVVLVELLLDLRGEGGYLAVEISQVLLDGADDFGAADTRSQAVGFSLTEFLQAVMIADHLLQLALRFSQRSPQWERLGAAEVEDDQRITRIGLVALQLALGVLL